MKWLPHDLGTWSFILSVAALALTVPLGMVGTLLAPKVQLWWFIRSVRGTANELTALVEYRQQLEKEPLFSPTEAFLYEQQLRVLMALHLLAYLVVLAVAMIPKVHPHMTVGEDWIATRPAIPFVVILIASGTYFGSVSLNRLRRSAPNERTKTEERIGKLVAELQKKAPPKV